MQTYLITMGDGSARVRYRGYEVAFPSYRDARFFQRVADKAIAEYGHTTIMNEFKDIGYKVTGV